MTQGAGGGGAGSAAPRVDWDAVAAAFGDEPDHGVRDADVRRAWPGRPRSWLPARPGDVLDLGRGTGSRSLLAAEQGHAVTGVDLSPAMPERARAELAGHDAVFLTGDGAAPVGERCFEAVLVRHVLWTLPEPARRRPVRPGRGGDRTGRRVSRAGGHGAPPWRTPRTRATC